MRREGTTTFAMIEDGLSTPSFWVNAMERAVSGEVRQARWWLAICGPTPGRPGARLLR